MINISVISQVSYVVVLLMYVGLLDYTTLAVMKGIVSTLDPELSISNVYVFCRRLSSLTKSGVQSYSVICILKDYDLNHYEDDGI